MTTNEQPKPSMVELLKAELSTPGTRWRRVEIPASVGWVSCPRCLLPFQTGTRLYFDTQTKKGFCQDCGDGPDEVVDLPF